MTTLLIINNQTMICENTSVDDRPASAIQIDGYIVLDQAQVPSVSWDWQEPEWVQVDDIAPSGGIGFVYEGGKLIAPKPTEPPQDTSQPIVDGAQTL